MSLANTNYANVKEMKFESANLSKEVLTALYLGMLKPRMIEEKMHLLIRQGKISKWFSGIGQEAITIGCMAALTDDEYVLPLHRNLGVFTWRKIPLQRLFAQFQGKMSGFTKGRDRSFHFGTQEYHIIGMISHLGAMPGVGDGIALGHKLRNEKKAVVVFSGDGGTSEGDFHEALNVASVWDLPVIFVIENNGYGLSTPVNEQYRCKRLVDRAAGYGIQGVQIDGNNILEVFTTFSRVAESVRENARPFLVECLTFRMRGHEEASGTKYIPIELLDEWKKKDPLQNYEEYLLTENILTGQSIKNYRSSISDEINHALETADHEPMVKSDAKSELNDIYSAAKPVVAETPAKKINTRFVDAISDGLRTAMRKHKNLIIMGQDIAEYGGVFKVTGGFLQEFGKERVRNTPLCESAIIGAALGLSINGFKSVVEMQFADFITCGFNQVVNNLAKSHWRWGQNADVVIRMPTGAGVGAGPFHSQSTEAWFFHTPGLKVVYPAYPADAKGLLISAIEDPNPVLFFEHKALYRSITGDVPDEYYAVEIGKANLLREGKNITIITYGMGVHWALEALEQERNISADLIDLRTLLPLDMDAIFKSVRKTGKAIILHEDTLTGGIGAEIAARITEHCFEHLDAPVVRCGALDTPVPFAAELEKNFLPKEILIKKIQRILLF